MRRSIRRFAAFPVLAVLVLSAAGCAKVPGGAEEEGEKAAKVEKIEGTDQSKVVLLEEAAKRLGIETSAVGRLTGGQESVPYSAVIYDAEGQSWVFTTNEDLSYVKAPITIERIDGDLAILNEGPPVGTEVVTQGAAELYGVEDGIGEFE
jgi:multidrug efflux pump subunit AcrA (membrane-fusion protein)